MHQYTNVISRILNQRHNKDKAYDHKTESTASLFSISNLPFALTSECASFLPLSDYFRFSQCNRKTYLALHQQPKLCTFPGNYV